MWSARAQAARRAVSSGLYDATTGAVIAAPLIAPLYYPVGAAVSGNHLYLPQQENLIFGYINVYDATTGSLLVYQFIPNLLHQPLGLVLGEHDLFEANGTDGTIGKYNAKTGATINAAFISGLNGPNQMALLEKKLFVTNSGNGTVGKYDTTTGAAINPALISGFDSPLRHRDPAPPSRHRLNLPLPACPSTAWRWRACRAIAQRRRVTFFIPTPVRRNLAGVFAS